MSKKLTLRLSPALIKRAKTYAKQHETSVSQVVSDYFAVLNDTLDTNQPLSLPITNSLKGLLKSSRITEEDYKKHLEKKYL